MTGKNTTVARFAFCAFIGLGISLSGCASLGEVASIYHNRTVMDGTNKPTGVTAVTIDAKQRNLIVSAPKGASSSSATVEATVIGDDADAPKLRLKLGDIPARPRVCAEPSPDVFSAYSASVTGDTNIGLVIRPKADQDINLSNKMAASLGETASALERTQAINLIRESMYRTCERYLSGAIDSDEFVIQASRDHRAMLAFLAIEQITAPLRPAPVVISGPGLTTGLGGSVDAAKELNEAIKTQVGADVDKKAADDAVTLKTEAAKGIDCAKPSDVDKPKCDALTQAKADQTKAVKAKSEADKRVVQWTLIATSAAGGGGASVEAASAAILSQKAYSQSDLTQLASVSDNVERIFSKANDFDELIMLCVLKWRKNEVGDELNRLCANYFDKEAASLKLQEINLLQNIEAMGFQYETEASAFVKDVKSKNITDADLVLIVKNFIQTSNKSVSDKKGKYIPRGKTKIYEFDVNASNVYDKIFVLFKTLKPDVVALNQFKSIF